MKRRALSTRRVRSAILFGSALSGTTLFAMAGVAQSAAPAQTQSPAARSAANQKKAAAKARPGTQSRDNPVATESFTVLGAGTPTQHALAEQKNAIGVSTIMSRTQIEQAPETNLADILTRLPGLSAYSDMTGGQAATGENEYVTIRGLDASYDAYSLNGERIAPSDPTTRAISFDMLAPYGISSVKIDKTPGADQDGDAIGGAIDIRIPDAFDFTGNMLKVSTQGQIAQLASRLGVPSHGGNVEIEGARRFGHDGAFGVYVSGYYENKNVAGTTVSPNKGYVPTNEDASPAGEATDLTTTALKYDVYTTNLVRYGTSLSLDYRGADQTAYLRSTFGQYDKTENDNQASIIGADGGYDADGIFVSEAGIRGQYFETDDSKQSLLTQKLGGTTDLARWRFDYDVFNSYSTLAEPDQVEASMYPSTYADGPLFFAAGGLSPHVQGSPAAISYLDDQNNDRLWKTQGRDAQSIADMYGIHLDATYRFQDPILETLKFGIKVSDTDRESWEHPYTHDDNNFIYDGAFFGSQESAYNAATGPEVGSLPGQQVGAFGGQLGQLRILNRGYIDSLIVPYKYQNNPNGSGDYTTDDWNSNSSSGNEKVYAGYLMTALHAGPVQIYPGFRYEWTQFDGQHWEVNGDDATGEFVGVRQSYGEPLPVLNIDWRPTAESVLRFSVRRSFSRPAFGLINGATTVTTDDLTNQVVAVSEPNPNLKPSNATDFDLSGELYNRHSGVLSLSLYDKAISDFIFTSVSDKDNSATLGGLVPTGTFVDNGTEYSMPQNGGSATLVGLELNLEQRLWFLPGWANGLGVESNVTLQHSRAASGIPGHPRTSLPQAPDVICNLGTYYAIGAFRADLNYTYAGTQLFLLNSTLPDFYLQPTERLDLSAKYRLPRGLTVSFSAQNLLDTPVFWETEGRSKAYLAYDSSANGAYVTTGRTFLLGLSAEL